MGGGRGQGLAREVHGPLLALSVAGPQTHPGSTWLQTCTALGTVDVTYRVCVIIK